MTRPILVPLLFLAAALGCGSSSPSTNDAGSTGTGGSTGGGGSGGADAGSTSKIANFVGTWQVVSGTINVQCDDGSSKTVNVTSGLVFAKGISSDLVETSNTACPVKYTIAGTVASAAPASCKDAQSGITQNLKADTFTTTDGANGTENGSGTFDGVTDANGAPVGCTWSGTATYQRISQ